MRLIAALMALPLSTPLWADCPAASDLETGIRFTLSNGDSEVFRSHRPDIVEAVFSFRDDPDWTVRNYLAQGTYLLEWIDVKEGVPQYSTRSTYAFEKNPQDLPRPEPDTVLTLPTVSMVEGEIKPEVQTYTFGAITQKSFGACQYDMIPITVTYEPNEENTIDTLHYLPALGIAYFAASTFDGGDDSYDYNQIEAVK